ncbi:hypothetical protein NPS70_19890 [Streptomyces sp. C10-9-1]|uniref:hypothetical protein n=1 Tax=Streptomyces sp. C10-9-1 TaxID=1859285 RepID=UPI00211216B6|nr:hypothetical protein [Streptomyces sp. C10-9-1]MCQ6555441.1 hypothetical protein [Streptomyces sp. C10-9-1]
MSSPQGNTPQWRPTPPQRPPRKKPRVFLWVFLGVQLLFLIWLITGIASGSGTPEDCGTLDAQTCNEAENVGTAIGVGLILVLWAVVDVILGITYAVYRFSRRP